MVTCVAMVTWSARCHVIYGEIIRLDEDSVRRTDHLKIGSSDILETVGSGGH